MTHRRQPSSKWKRAPQKVLIGTRTKRRDMQPNISKVKHSRRILKQGRVLNRSTEPPRKKARLERCSHVQESSTIAPSSRITSEASKSEKNVSTLQTRTAHLQRSTYRMSPRYNSRKSPNDIGNGRNTDVKYSVTPSTKVQDTKSRESSTKARESSTKRSRVRNISTNIETSIQSPTRPLRSKIVLINSAPQIRRRLRSNSINSPAEWGNTCEKNRKYFTDNIKTTTKQSLQRSQKMKQVRKSLNFYDTKSRTSIRAAFVKTEPIEDNVAFENQQSPRMDEKVKSSQQTNTKTRNLSQDLRRLNSNRQLSSAQDREGVQESPAKQTPYETRSYSRETPKRNLVVRDHNYTVGNGECLASTSAAETGTKRTRHKVTQVSKNSDNINVEHENFRNSSRTESNCMGLKDVRTVVTADNSSKLPQKMIRDEKSEIKLSRRKDNRVKGDIRGSFEISSFESVRKHAKAANTCADDDYQQGKRNAEPADDIQLPQQNNNLRKTHRADMDQGTVIRIKEQNITDTGTKLGYDGQKTDCAAVTTGKAHDLNQAKNQATKYPKSINQMGLSDDVESTNGVTNKIQNKMIVPPGKWVKIKYSKPVRLVSLINSTKAEKPEEVISLTSSSKSSQSTKNVHPSVSREGCVREETAAENAQVLQDSLKCDTNKEQTTQGTDGTASIRITQTSESQNKPQENARVDDEAGTTEENTTEDNPDQNEDATKTNETNNTKLEDIPITHRDEKYAKQDNNELIENVQKISSNSTDESPTRGRFKKSIRNQRKVGNAVYKTSSNNLKHSTAEKDRPRLMKAEAEAMVLELANKLPENKGNCEFSVDTTCQNTSSDTLMVTEDTFTESIKSADPLDLKLHHRSLDGTSDGSSDRSETRTPHRLSEDRHEFPSDSDILTEYAQGKLSSGDVKIIPSDGAKEKENITDTSSRDKQVVQDDSIPSTKLTPKRSTRLQRRKSSETPKKYDDFFVTLRKKISPKTTDQNQISPKIRTSDPDERKELDEAKIQTTEELSHQQECKAVVSKTDEVKCAMADTSLATSLPAEAGTSGQHVKRCVERKLDMETDKMSDRKSSSPKKAIRVKLPVELLTKSLDSKVHNCHKIEVRKRDKLKQKRLKIAKGTKVRLRGDWNDPGLHEEMGIATAMESTKLAPPDKMTCENKTCDSPTKSQLKETHHIKLRFLRTSQGLAIASSYLANAERKRTESSSSGSTSTQKDGSSKQSSTSRLKKGKKTKTSPRPAINLNELMKNEILEDHSFTLWKSDWRQGIRRAHKGDSEEQIDSILRSRWMELSQEEKKKYFVRVLGALTDENKHSPERFLTALPTGILENRPNDVTESGLPTQSEDEHEIDRKVDAFHQMSVAKQHYLLKQNFTYIQRALSKEKYNNFILFVKKTLTELRTKAKEGRSREEIEQETRNLMFRDVLVERKALQFADVQARNLNVVAFKKQLESFVQQSLNGKEMPYDPSVRCSDLRQALLDLQDLEAKSRISVCGEEMRSRSFESLIQDIQSSGDKLCQQSGKRSASTVNVPSDLTDGEILQELPPLPDDNALARELLLENTNNVLQDLDIALIESCLKDSTSVLGSGNELKPETRGQEVLNALLEDAVTALDCLSQRSPCCELDSPSCILSSLLVMEKLIRAKQRSCV